MIPLNDLSRFIRTNRMEIKNAMSLVLDRGMYVLGESVTEFERAWSSYVGCKNTVTVANGTDAIQLALQALDLPSRSMVCTVANAGMYSTTSILAAGLEPFFVDVDLDSALVNLEAVEFAIKNGCRAVIVTHLYGRLVPDIEQISALCKQSGVWLIEDCAQAHGAKLGNKKQALTASLQLSVFIPQKIWVH